MDSEPSRHAVLKPEGTEAERHVGGADHLGMIACGSWIKHCSWEHTVMNSNAADRSSDGRFWGPASIVTDNRLLGIYHKCQTWLPRSKTPECTVSTRCCSHLTGKPGMESRYWPFCQSVLSCRQAQLCIWTVNLNVTLQWQGRGQSHLVSLSDQLRVPAQCSGAPSTGGSVGEHAWELLSRRKTRPAAHCDWNTPVWLLAMGC